MKKVLSFVALTAALVAAGSPAAARADVPGPITTRVDGLLSAVTDVIDAPANDVLELDSGLLLPLVGACVLDVDLQAGRILVAPGYADSPDA